MNEMLASGFCWMKKDGGRGKKDPRENTYPPFKYAWFTMYIHMCNACHLTNLTKRCWHGVAHTQRKTHSELNRMIQVKKNMQGHLLIKTYFAAAVVQKFHSPDSADPERRHSNRSLVFSLELEPHHLPHLFWAFQVPEKCSWLSDSQAVVGLFSLWLPGHCGTIQPLAMWANLLDISYHCTDKFYWVNSYENSQTKCLRTMYTT